MVLPFSSVTHTFSLSSFRACSDIARAAVAHASLSPFRACSCSGSLSVGHRRSPPRTSQLRPCSSLTHIDPFVHSFTFSVFLLPHQPDAGLAPLLRVGISALLPGKATFYYKLFQTPSPCDTLDSGTDSPLAALAGLARRPHWLNYPPEPSTTSQPRPDMDEPPMELPFEASLLTPFLVAWRAAPTSGDEGVRLAAVASTMKKYDREFDEAKAKAAAAALALRLDELDRDIDEGVRSLRPEDAACVSCGLKGTFTSSSRPTVMHLLDKPIDVKVVTTVCSACGCIHRFNECSAFEACVVLLHHKPSVVKSLQARLVLVELHLQMYQITSRHVCAVIWAREGRHGRRRRSCPCVGGGGNRFRPLPRCGSG